MQKTTSQLNAHPPRTQVQQPTNTRHSQPNPPQPLGIDVVYDVHAALLAVELQLPVDWHLGVEAALGFRFGGGGGGAAGGRVQRRRRQHLRRRVDEVHGVHRRAVELVEVEARDVVVGVGVCVEGLEGFVSTDI